MSAAWVDPQRFKIREVAMYLAHRGLDAETIREAMIDMATTEAEHAIAWAAEEDRRMAAEESESLVHDLTATIAAVDKGRELDVAPATTLKILAASRKSA